jgi:anti-sigma regulatory factor (Ser/Thr protein kinase)
MIEGVGAVELIVSELVTNGLKATEALEWAVPPPVRLRLSSDRSRVLVEVWDGSAQSPVLVHANEATDGGRGLLLVETLSTRWSWYFPQGLGGKVVWAEVSVQ